MYHGVFWSPNEACYFLLHFLKKFLCFRGMRNNPRKLILFHNFPEQINVQKKGFRWHKNPKADFLKVHSEFIISESFLRLSQDLFSNNEPEAPIHSSEGRIRPISQPKMALLDGFIAEFAWPNASWGSTLNSFVEREYSCVYRCIYMCVCIHSLKPK